MIITDLSDLRDELGRQRDRLDAAIELFQVMIEPGTLNRAGRGLDVILQDAIEAADRMEVTAAALVIEAGSSAMIVAEHLKK